MLKARNATILCAMTVSLTLVSNTAFAGDEAPKNVLVFFVDDLRPDLGCYGHELIKSPAIDQLASEGVLFERAYCQQALCAPSRISMMSGSYPASTGIFDLWTPLIKVKPNAMTMPRYFRQRGYETFSFGKVYHHNRDDKSNWTILAPKNTVKYTNPKTLNDIMQRTALGTRNGASVDEIRIMEKGPATESADVPDDAYPDGRVASQAIKVLRQKSAKPFFLCVGLAKPHLPFAAPKRYWDLYRREQFRVPERRLPSDAPSLAFTTWGELRSYHDMPKNGNLTDAQTRELRHGYAACVSYADAQVGRVMAELNRLGLRQNTIVVLWGDHGYKLGDYGLWCKHTNLELDANVPFLVSAPGFAAGKRSGELVEMVDIFPTLARLTDGKVPASCDGMSLEPLLTTQRSEQADSQPFRSFALTQYPRGSTMGFSIRTNRWRYTEWFNSKTNTIVGRELYDHQVTQSPVANLATNPEYEKLVARLSRQLNAPARSQTLEKTTH